MSLAFINPCKNIILPYLSNNVNKRILLQHKTRKKLPKIK